MMKPSLRIGRRTTSFWLLLIVGLLLTACSRQPAVDEQSGSGLAPQIGVGDEGSTDDDESESELQFGCERQIVDIKLNHIWAFSPGGDPSNGAIHTTATGSCLIEVNEENLARITPEASESGAPGCLYSYELHGDIKTDDGQCEVHGSGIAQVEISGSCSFGVVEVLILESLLLPEGVDPVFGFDLDSSGVTIMCPGMEEPQEYITIFPLSSFAGQFDQSSAEQKISGQVVCPDNSFVVCEKGYTARPISAQ